MRTTFEIPVFLSYCPPVPIPIVPDDEPAEIVIAPIEFAPYFSDPPKFTVYNVKVG